MNSNNTTGNIEPAVALPDLQTKINSSVSGFVTDQNDAAVVGAEVKAGTTSTMTDRYGYFEIKNVQVVKEAATVTVIYPGYFKGIKTYMATEGKSAFFRIKLLQKTIIGSIDANAGGNVSIINGMNISFPANAIKDANGNIYNGTVNVAAQYIDPTSTEIDKIMPGDLRGINAEGYMKELTSFGMMGVELTGNNGDLLQIADGKKSTITIPLPASISSAAPSSIPLWHFDEGNGLWQEEGSAIKNGNSYVAEVGHFSYWNCDVPAPSIHFECTIVDNNDIPVPNVRIKVIVLNDPLLISYSAYGNTDGSGYLSAAIPANSQLQMQVMGCGNIQYAKNFTSGNTSLSLGNIRIGNENVATVTGTAIDCNNNPVTSGRVILLRGNEYFLYPVNNGHINFSVAICNNVSNVNLVVQDNSTSQQTNTISTTLQTGSNDIGSHQVCGLNTQEYLTYNFNGTDSASLISPSDLVLQILDPYYGNNYIYMYGQSNTGTSNHHFGFTIPLIGLAAGTDQPMIYYNAEATTVGVTYNSVIIHITEYGNIGEFIAGNFDGIMTGMYPPYDLFHVTCSFRMRRNN